MEFAWLVTLIYSSGGIGSMRGEYFSSPLYLFCIYEKRWFLKQVGVDRLSEMNAGVEHQATYFRG